MKRGLKNLGKWSLHRLFGLGQRLGVDILPRHFYTEIPCLRRLAREEAWKGPRSMVGVRGADIEEQLAFLQSCRDRVPVESLGGGRIHDQACRMNGQPGFGPVESDVLYCFVASRRPPRIVQVGCGTSTAVIQLAAEEAGYRPHVTCIDPYPTAYLRDLASSGRITLHDAPAQSVDLGVLTELADGDLLFVDSTHAVTPGGEVNRLILEVLPNLATGSWAHFHDIYFPYDYSRELLSGDLFFPHESILLHAFLALNERFTMKTSLSMLHYAAGERLQALFPGYRPAGNDHGLGISDGGHFPSSVYLQVVA